jgi:hypothetical protein
MAITEAIVKDYVSDECVFVYGHGVIFLVREKQITLIFKNIFTKI